MNEPPRTFRFGEYDLDEQAFELRKDGQRVELQPKPLRLLLYLVQNRKRAIGKQELFDQIWADAIVSESALTSALRDLRRALDDDGKVPGTIETIRGRGYRFIAPVREVSVDSSETLPAERSRWNWQLGIAAGVIATLVVAGWWIARRSESPPFSGLPDPIHSLAVLPLENLSGDPQQEYFADGMTEALIGDLGRIGSLRVISRTSVVQYEDDRKPLPEIAAELGVDAILEGTIMRAGDRVRITAQLIDARSDSQLWSERYDRELSEVLVLQSEVARAVARALQIKLTAAESTALTVERTIDPRAYDAFLRGVEGMYQEGRFSRPMLEQFERAAALDPSFAEAFAYVALFRAYLGDLSRAREPAQTALELDESSGKAHLALAWVRLVVDWDFGGSERAFERALQLTPDDAAALGMYAIHLFFMGRFDESLAFSDRATLLAPLSWPLQRNKPKLLAAARRYDRALEQIERLRELFADRTSFEVGRAYWIMGRHEEAHREFIAYWKQYPDFDWAREAHERGWNEGGWEGARRALLSELIRREEPPHSSPAGARVHTYIAASYVDLGESDEALAWLERGYRERDPGMLYLKVSPLFDPLRSDPRFDDLLRRIGFPET